MITEGKKTGIIGAGALGAYFIYGLAEKLKDNLIVIAENERKEKLQNNGIIINNKKYELNVKTPLELPELDFLIITLKYNSLKSSLELIKNSINEKTIILCPMNGVNTEEIIEEYTGVDNIIRSFAQIAAERIENKMEFNPKTTPGLFFGDKNSNIKTERIEKIEELFKNSNVRFTFCEDIMTAMWNKFALNIGCNLPQAIIGCGMGGYDDSEYVLKMLKLLRKEVVDVAKALGVNLSYEPDNSMAGIVKKNARYSTLQDLDAKRHTEIDAFSGVMIELGKKYNIKTPCNEFTYCIIKALEEKNDGKFNY